MDLLILFVVMVFSILFGWNLRERYAVWKTAQYMHALEQHVEDAAKDMIRVKIEKHEGRLYVYDMETSRFMAQASTKSELEDILGKEYPGKKFAVTPENLKEIGFIS